METGIVKDLKALAADYGEKLRAYRRHLHRHPELSFKETQTSAWIREKLGQFGIEQERNVSGNSTVGLLKSERPGPCLLFRADIDALPIKEESGLDFSSEYPGVMHACGHDAHTAVLLCFAHFLAHNRDLIRGTVKLVFQQGEERVPGGGSVIVRDGILKDVDAVFAWHCAPEQEVGRVIVAGGGRTASFDNFEIIIRGRGGHGGFPFCCDDVITTGAQVVAALAALPMHTIDPLDSLTMNLSRFGSGAHETYNIIPGEARIEGSIRSLDNTSSKKLLKRVEAVAEGICRAGGCSCEFIKHAGYPALINDDGLAARLKQALIREGIDARTSRPIMGAEDFAFYTIEKPGVYINVGTHNPEEPDTAYPPHNPHFCIDERSMEIALASLFAIYREMTA